MSRFPGNIIKLPNVTPTQSSASGVWSLKDQMVYQRNNLWPFQPDPYFNYTTLLLQGNVPNTTGPQAMTLPLSYNADASTNNFLVTPNGDVGPRPFSPYFGGNYSVYFDGTDDYLSVADTAALDFGSGNFTIETWIYMAGGSGATRMVFAKWASNVGIELYVSTANKLEAYINAGVVATSTGTLALNQWYHVALVRSGTGSNQTKLYINGSEDGSGTAGSSVDNAASVNIGTSNAGSNDFTGYMSNYRVVKGIAVYSGSFNPSTSSLTATQSAGPTGSNIQAITGSETSLLTCQSNRFIDNSSTPKTITVNGDSRITDNSPFVSTDFTTGAGYFDGNDYLTVASNSAFTFTGDFTWEGWFYMTANPSQARSARLIDYNATNNFLVFTTSDGTDYLGFIVAGTFYSTTTALPRNQWAHVAVSRSGTGANNLKMFLNGTAISTQSNNSTITAAQIYISNAPGFDGYFTGYISGYRLTNTGSSTITVPTAPATTASALLTLQTRAPSQNISFLDSSPNEFLVTKNGNTTQGTFSPFSPTGWGAYFDGTNDYVNNSTLNSTYTGDFTFEAWVYISSFSSNLHFFGQGSETTNRWLFGTTSAGRLFANPYGGSDIFFGSNGDVTAGSWLHIAFVRSGSGTNNITGYVNGQSKGTGTSTATVGNSGGFGIGAGQNGSGPMNGYMSNVRYTAQALYTSNFTPSAVPLTTTSQGASSSNVKVLALQSNRFVDNAAIPNTLTPNNGVSVQAFSPFAPANAVSPLVTGGSGYFNGTTDYLGIADNTALELGSGDFTIESWVYLTALPSSTFGQAFIAKWNASNYSYLAGTFNNSGTMQLAFNYTTNGSTAVVTRVNASITTNNWFHAAYVRSGGSLKIFLNGTEITSSATISGTLYDGTEAVNIGRSGDNFNYVTGYLSGTRIVKGTALYTANFTPPTTPPTAIPNTSLLLNFTNGAAVDATGKNNLESVGNAQNSGVQAKWDPLRGGSSMYFDGTDDRLSNNNAANPLYAFRTGDFTIEAWVYPLVNTGERGWFQTSDTAGGLKTSYPTGVCIFTGPTPNAYWLAQVGSTAISTTTSVATNTWTHIAITRASGSVRMFVNGNLAAGPTNATGDLTGQYICVGGYYSTTYLWNGYLSNVRVTNYARYTAAFNTNLPTGPFPIG